MNSEIIFKEFSIKWKLERQEVFTIYRMIQDAGRKYGKVSRTIRKWHIVLSPRQLKYFYRKTRLAERVALDTKGKPKNWRDLLRKST